MASMAWAALRGASILLAEDNEINQQVARELLEGAGLGVTIAHHGQEAIDLLRDQRFDAVLMDIQMPVMDGLSATKAIRARADLSQLPIIAMTAHAMRGDRDKSLAAGMNDHVSKPIDPGELFATLQRWIPPKTRAPVAAAVSHPDTPSVELPDLPGYDMEAGLNRMSGNQRLYRESLIKFERDFADVDQRLLALLRADQREEAERLAHSLKGVAGTLGHDALQQAAEAIECGVRDQSSDLEQRLHALADALAPALQPLQRLAAETLEVVTTGVEPTLDVAELRAALEDLKQNVQERSVNRCRVVWEEIEARSSPAELAPALRELGQSLGKYRFKQAETQLDALLERLQVGRIE
jgi:CheY-like chemotaxis protein